MTSTTAKAAVPNEVLDELFDGIADDTAPGVVGPPSNVKSAPDAIGAVSQPSEQSEQDILAELDNLASERPGNRLEPPKPTSSATLRAGSPRPDATATTAPVRSSTSSGDTRDGPPAGPKATRVSTEDSGSSFHYNSIALRSSGPEEDGENRSTKPAHRSAESSRAGGGWWGGLVATASAAVKTAEAAVKEIQHNEEAKRWAEQVKGNVGALRGLGDEIRSRALPTFTNILQTLAPPISVHERLQIHITHDLVGYPSLEALVYQTFSRVMAQVEGGDLLVIQRGEEASPRRKSETGFAESRSGWGDGPWWRQPTVQRSLALVKGLVEGTKLAKVSTESYAAEFYSTRGGIEKAAERAAQSATDSNPSRSSDIFLGIQAISQSDEVGLFGGPAQQSLPEPESESDELALFAIYLYDPVHSITFRTVTQAFPLRWVEWLDTPTKKSDSAVAGMSGSQELGTESVPRRSGEGAPPLHSHLHEDIAAIIRDGGVDPREWIAEWIEEVLSLGIGVVSQRYVAKRMGVGDGGIVRVRAPDCTLESGGGEAAKAI